MPYAILPSFSLRSRGAVKIIRAMVTPGDLPNNYRMMYTALVTNELIHSRIKGEVLWCNIEPSCFWAL